MTARPDGPDRTAAAPWRAALASSVGSVLEFYDFFVYGPLAALVFATVFFPEQSVAVGTLLSLSTFAVGFVARPVGGAIFGHLGDRLGRKRVLVSTFVVTGVATVAIGLLPTYGQVGIWAPVALVTLRFLQGVGLGGEWGGAALLTVEHAPAGRRGFFGSLVQAGAPLGIIASSGVVALLTAVLSRPQLLAWGWRIPFLISLLLIVVGLVIRLQVAESPEFQRIKTDRDESRAPVLEVIRRFPKQILAAILVHVGDTTLGFVLGIFVIGYATNVLHMNPTTVLLANVAGAAANLLVTPVAGHLCDRVGRRRVLAFGMVAMLVWAFPMFWLIDSRSVPALFVACLVGSAIVGTLYSPQAAFFAELFEPRVRYSGMSLGFQVATIAGGGFGPIVAQALQSAGGGGTWLVATYLAAVAVIGLVTVLLTRPMRAAVGVAPAPASAVRR